MPQERAVARVRHLLARAVRSLGAHRGHSGGPHFDVDFVHGRPKLFVNVCITFFTALTIVLRSRALSNSI